MPLHETRDNASAMKDSRMIPTAAPQAMRECPAIESVQYGRNVQAMKLCDDCPNRRAPSPAVLDLVDAALNVSRNHDDGSAWARLNRAIAAVEKERA